MSQLFPSSPWVSFNARRKARIFCDHSGTARRELRGIRNLKFELAANQPVHIYNPSERKSQTSQIDLFYGLLPWVALFGWTTKSKSPVCTESTRLSQKLTHAIGKYGKTCVAIDVRIAHMSGVKPSRMTHFASNEDPVDLEI
jgi:hypothetical protein